MYIAEYRGADNQSIFQALVYFPKLVLEGGSPDWAAAYDAFIERLLLTTEGSFAYRTVHFAGRIGRYVLLTATGRAALNGLSSTAAQLNQIVPRSAVLPENKEEHDRYSERFPAIRRNVCRDLYFAGKFEVPCEFYASPLAPLLLRAALASKTDFGLQVNCRPHKLSPDQLRASRKHLADLSLLGHAPARVVGYVTQRVAALPANAFLVEECIGVSSPAQLAAAAALIESSFHDLTFSIGFSGSSLGDPVQEEEITMGLHSTCFDETAISQCMWRGVHAKVLGDWLKWTPGPEWASLGVVDAVKSASTHDLLHLVLRKLEDLEEKSTRHPHRHITASFRGALKTGQIDHPIAAGAARAVVEQIARIVFAEVCPSEAKKVATFERMIERLRETGNVPGPVFSAMHGVRITGNIGAHRTADLTRGDVEACMMAALRVVEWFLSERPHPG